jgi:probable F420-dependent oxidoreductase
MDFDVMVPPSRWTEAAELARRTEQAGFTGMTFTDVGQTPWMSIAAAATAAPSLTFTTGIAVAFPMSPMMAACIAWELADNTHGRYRLGLGSQVKAHIERRYSVAYDPPGPRMRDYVLAVQDIFAAFRGEKKLDHHGKFYELTLLPKPFTPAMHPYGDIKIDISAVGPWMVQMAGQHCDGIHVHPLHSMHYLETRLLPDVAIGAEKAGRPASACDLLIPVFIVPGDTPEERAFLTQRARTQIGFYGSTKNYAFQFTDLGFDGVSEALNVALKSGDMDALANTITDEMLEHYAVVGRWDEIADQLIARYGGLAERVISYLTVEDLERHPENFGKWSEIARAVRDAKPASRR